MWKEPFVLSWKGLTNGGRRGMGPPSSNLTLLLVNPVLTLSMERDWDRQKRDSIIYRSLQLINKPAASFGSARWCLPYQSRQECSTALWSVPGGTNNLLCQKSPLEPAASSAGLQKLAKTHRRHPSLCENHFRKWQILQRSPPG